MSELPLANVRVLDFSKILAGPLCAQYLGDMGADVIKIESASLGDDTRYMPPFRETGQAREGAIYLSANRNKRSLAIDMASPAGREILYRLAKTVDVTLSSFGPGVAKKLGLDAATLRALNPRLICCEISGFGTVGPMRDGKGYDVILQAFCGMLSMTGEPGGPPVRSPFSPVDQATGLHAMGGILAALYRRERTGAGCTLDASLFDTAAGFLSSTLQNFWERGTEPEKAGSGHESLCPYQVFETADKPLILGVANDALWKRFCNLAGLDDLCNDRRFRTNADRVRNRAETVSLVAAVLATRPRDVWLPALDAAGLPVSAVHSLGEFSDHAHSSESGMKLNYKHPVLGPLQGVAHPLRIDGERAAVRMPPPMHGEQGAEILGELGYDPAQVEMLVAAGTLQLSPRPVH